MKLIRNLTVIAAALSLVAGPMAGFAADDKKPADGKKPEVRPYKLETCAVSDEKLGEMGKPFVFEHKGQEIKLCCKSCKKDFDKNPDKFLKKMQESEKKAAAKAEKKAEKAADKAKDSHGHDAHAGHNH